MLLAVGNQAHLVAFVLVGLAVACGDTNTNGGGSDSTEGSGDSASTTSSGTDASPCDCADFEACLYVEITRAAELDHFNNCEDPSWCIGTLVVDAWHAGDKIFHEMFDGTDMSTAASRKSVEIGCVPSNATLSACAWMDMDGDGGAGEGDCTSSDSNDMCPDRQANNEAMTLPGESSVIEIVLISNCD